MCISTADEGQALTNLHMHEVIDHEVNVDSSYPSYRAMTRTQLFSNQQSVLASYVAEYRVHLVLSVVTEIPILHIELQEQRMYRSIEVAFPMKYDYPGELAYAY